jgi:hypothetical protein
MTESNASSARVLGPRWNTHGRDMSPGRFPLQVEQAVLNPVSRLVPGVTTVTTHARYYALHGLTAHYAAENALSRADAQDLVRRCEVIMGAASLVDDHENADFYGRPHGFRAMQDVLKGGDLDVEGVSSRGAYATAAWGFRGTYLGAERRLRIVASGNTWKPEKRYDHKAVLPALEPVLEMAANPVVTATQLREIAPHVSIYRFYSGSDGRWLAGLLCSTTAGQDSRRRATLQLMARVIETHSVTSLTTSLLHAIAFGDFIEVDPVASSSEVPAMWRGVLLRNFSVGAWRRLWAWLVDQVCDGTAVSDTALEDLFAEQLPASSVDSMLSDLPSLEDAKGHPVPVEEGIRPDSGTKVFRELQILACGALRSQQLEGVTRAVYNRATGNDLDPQWMFERLAHSGPQSLQDFGRSLVREMLTKSRRVALSKAEVRDDGTLWIPSRLHQRGDQLFATAREGSGDVGTRLRELGRIAAASGVFDKSGPTWQLTGAGRELLA